MPPTKDEALIEIHRRIRQDKLSFYHSSPTATRLHQSRKKIRAWFAPNRIGKTYSLSAESIWLVTKTHPFRPPLDTGPIKGRICCVDYKTLNRAMIDDSFKVLTPRKFLKGESWEKAYSKEDRTLYFTKKAPIYGGFIEFMSYDQKVEAYEGTARHFIWEDEEAPEEIHSANLARLGTYDGLMIISMTPVKPKLWVISDIYEKSENDDNIEIFKGEVSENPLFNPKTESGKKRLDAHMYALDQISDPVERNTRKTGDFSWYAGKIYPTYCEKHHIEPFTPPAEWPLVVAIDPHPTKNTAVTFAYWCLHTESVYFLEELWEDAITGVEAICGNIRMMCHKRTPAIMVIDPKSDWDPKLYGVASAYNQFKEQFPSITKWTSRPGSVWAGVTDIREMLKINVISDRPKLFVCVKNCPMTDWQMRHYGLKPPTQADKTAYKPVPVKIKDDFCDCVRGTVMYGQPVWTSEYMRESLEQKDEFGMKSYQG